MIDQLHQNVSDLTSTAGWPRRDPLPLHTCPFSHAVNLRQPTVSWNRIREPQQPHFIGPLRPSFGLVVGERSLTELGIPKFDTPPPSRPETPSPPPDGIQSLPEFWSRCSASQPVGLLTVWQEEVQSVYPFTDIGRLASKAEDILDDVRNDTVHGGQEDVSLETSLTEGEMNLVKVALATAMVVETHSNTEISAMIIASVELRGSRISNPTVDLASIQLQAMLVR